uniref:Protein kinase domain-containing protein n=1 Tax=Cucumis melo TaxID=3656 RepID=A0A9I9CKD1_CUCME
MAPEICNDEIFDRSIDSFSFGLILYEMVEGIQPFHRKPSEEVAKAICVEGKRPLFKIKSKIYPPDIKE